MPITVDSDNPYLPDNLNDPDASTPAIDPSTLPSGTLVRFPDGVEPKNMTPGDHPTQIEIDYPDGTATVVPTIIHIPAASENTAKGESLMMPNSSDLGMSGNDSWTMPSGNGDASVPAGE